MTENNNKDLQPTNEILRKPKGRPTFKRNYRLTYRECSVIPAILLTDAWLSHPPANKNPLIGFQNCDRNKPLVLYLNLQTLPPTPSGESSESASRPRRRRGEEEQ